MKTSPEYRKLNIKEREIIQALLAKKFRGRDEIREQLEDALVKGDVCKCGCLSINIFTNSSVIIPVYESVPVEARYRGDLVLGIDYQILLHVKAGKVKELEFVSFGTGIASEYPKISDLKIIHNE